MTDLLGYYCQIKKTVFSDSLIIIIIIIIYDS